MLPQICQIIKVLQIILYIGSDNDTARIQVVIKSLGLTQKLRTEDNIVAVEFFSNARRVANWDGALDNHNGFRVILNHQFYDCFDRTCVKEILLTIVISALKFVRRSCSTVAYKAHLLPYVATYPLFRA